MSHRLTDPDPTLEALRPRPAVDPAWAEAELERILSTSPSRWRRRRWWTTGGAAVAVIAVGGAAYAGGLVPSVVTDRLGEGDQSQPIHRIGDVREVFDLTTRDGTRVQYFAAPNDADGECWTVTHDLAPDAVTDDLAFACVSGPTTGFEPPQDDGVGLVPTDSEHTGSPILFGQSLGQFQLPVGTQQVRVVGPGLDRTLPTQAAEGWAVELPAGAKRATYLVEFLGATGEVLSRVEETVDGS